MSTPTGKPDSRLNNIAKTEDASTEKDSKKLIEVKKKDTAEDDDNDFVIYDKPFDEQMHDSADD
jgi:hypothetical protein